MGNKIFLCAVFSASFLLGACIDGSDHSKNVNTEKDFCDLSEGLVISGVVQGEGLVEPSGLVHSRTNSSVLWLHNDRGHAPQLFALNADGSILGTFEIDVEIKDWEDISIAPTEDSLGYYLYIGDIGDNFAQQIPDLERDNIVIYRIMEPDLSTLTPPFTEMIGAEKLESMTLRYPDGKAHNAETLFVDPENLDIYLVTKESDIFSTVYNGPSQVYRAQSGFETEGDVTLELVGEIDFFTLNEASSAAMEYADTYSSHNALATAGDISATREHIGIITYGTLWMWSLEEGQTIDSALSSSPCEAPTALAPKIENFAFDMDVESYTLLNETLEEDANLYSY